MQYACLHSILNVKNFSRHLFLFLCSVLLWGVFDSYAQSQDTLRLRVYFHQGKGDKIDPSFAGNGGRMAIFEEQLNSALRDGAYINGVFIRGSASPEGTLEFNKRLARMRADVMGDFFTDRLGINPGLVLSKAVGEDWEGLADEIRLMDVPWRDDALTIIANTNDTELRKRKLRLLDEGKAWKLLSDEVFPRLRSSRCDAIVTITRQEPIILERTDTLYVEVPVETIVEVPVEMEKPRKTFDTSGMKMLFAVRTNILAIPFSNVGVEVPIGEHISLAADWYSPWLWRKNHSAGIDAQGWCFEFQAVGGEIRYWFNNRKKMREQRLLGHSIGLYAAAGHYDFERNFSGYQGKFANAGIDYMFACPIFGGRLHMEFEIGLGFIYSPATPYDTFEPGGKAYYRPGELKRVQWWGPTRAQISLVLPLYIKTGGDR